MIDDGTLHIILTSGLSAVGVIAVWNLTTLIRLDKENEVLKVKVGNGLGEKVHEIKSELKELKTAFYHESDRQERFRRQRLGGKPEEE